MALPSTSFAQTRALPELVVPSIELPTLAVPKVRTEKIPPPFGVKHSTTTAPPTLYSNSSAAQAAGRDVAQVAVVTNRYSVVAPTPQPSTAPDPFESVPVVTEAAALPAPLPAVDAPAPSAPAVTPDLASAPEAPPVDAASAAPVDEPPVRMLQSAASEDVPPADEPAPTDDGSSAPPAEASGDETTAGGTDETITDGDAGGDAIDSGGTETIVSTEDPGGEGDPPPPAPSPPPPPQLSVTTISVDFGSVTRATTVSSTLTIENVGGADLTISSLAIESGDEVFAVVTGAPTTLAPGASLDVAVALTPNAVGAFSGSLRVQSDDPDGDVLVSLAGVGTAWQLDGGGARAPPAADEAWNHTLRIGPTAAQLVDSAGGVDEISLDGLAWIEIAGGALDDVLTLDWASVPSVDISFSGGGGNDTLRSAGGRTWNVSGPGSGTVDGVAFSGVEHLVGAPDADDVFVISGGGSVASFDGGAGGFDLARISGSSFHSTPMSRHSGRFVLDGASFFYDGLEPIDVSAAAVTVDGEDSSLLLESDFLRISPRTTGCSDAAGCIQVQFFESPLELLEIAELHWFNVTGLTSFTVNGGDGRDRVTISGAVTAGSAGVTVNAEEIVVEGSLTTTGNVTLAAAASVSGGIGDGLEACAVNALFDLTSGDIETALVENLGTHCSSASVTVDGGSVSGAVVDITATSTATPDSEVAIVPRSHADIAIIGGATISATGALTVKATSTVTIDLDEDTIAGFVGESRATVLVDGSAVSSSGGAVTIESNSTFTSTNDLTPASGGTGGGTDLAVAASVAISTATTTVTGASPLTATGNALTVKAVNKTDVKTTADATGSSGAGAAVALTLVWETTEAFLETTGAVNAASLDVLADSDNALVTTAKAAPDGATGNSKSPDDRTKNPETGEGNAKTSQGSMDKAAAIAFNYLNAPTEAHISGSGYAVTTGGQQKVHAGSKNNVSATADGSAVASGSIGVGIAVAVSLADVSNTAFVGGSGTLDGSKLLVEALIPAPSIVQAKSTSGAKGDSTDIAGSLAIAFLKLRDDASIADGASIDASGADVEVKAESTTETKAEAKAKIEGGTNTTGFGASVGIVIDDVETTAGLGAGAAVSNADDFTVSATTTDTMSNTVEGGTAGGNSITPIAAISVPNVLTKASIASGPLLDVDGALAVSATQTATSTTKAKGAAQGNISVGAALAWNAVDNTAEASLERAAAAAGDITVSASGRSTSTAEAEASAEGAKKDNDPSAPKTDDQTNAQRGAGDGAADR
ncbi:MAG TPA: choice-of-anchor D domain-containing protein, partial [Actinomycetota bacterium]